MKNTVMSTIVRATVPNPPIPDARVVRMPSRIIPMTSSTTAAATMIIPISDFSCLRSTSVRTEIPIDVTASAIPRYIHS